MGQHHLRTVPEIKYLAEKKSMRRGELSIDELLDENEKLRTLVVELSRIVARNALERK
jgi:hypothetical protein